MVADEQVRKLGFNERLKIAIRNGWKAIASPPILIFFTVVEFRNYTAIHNIYWSNQLHTVLLSFAGVVLGLLFVEISIFYTFANKVGDNPQIIGSIDSI